MRVLVVIEDPALCARVVQLIESCGHSVALAHKDRSETRPARHLRAAVVAPARFDAAGLAPARQLCADGCRVVVLAGTREGVEKVCRALPDADPLLAQPLDEAAFSRILSQMLAGPAGERPAEAAALQFEGCTLDLAGRAFFDENGREVRLTHREFELLALLARCSGRALSRDQLRQAISGRDHEPYDRAVDMQVSRLRHKIEPDCRRPSLILTVPGVGYKFAARVQRVVLPAAPPTAAPQPNGTGELRQLSVLACQIRGLAALAAQMSAEDESALRASVHGACAEVAARLGGLATRIVGESLLVYFGWRESQEHDPERAVRTGLGLARAVCGLGSQGALHGHVGIATGVAMVEASPGSPDAFTATGQPLNLALRLQAAAPSDGVLVAGRTRELVGEFFDCEPAGSLVLADGVEPVAVWRVTGERDNAGRFDALRKAGMRDMVGRRQEMELLRRRWAQAQRSAGQVVLVTGEPGIGKSRLVAEFQEELKSAPHAALRYFGAPDEADTPLSAVIGELQRAAGFDRADTAGERLAKLAALFERPCGGPRDDLVLIADLLSLPADGAPILPQLTPAQRRQRTRAALLARIGDLAARRPVLVLVEDAHWLDPTSVELFSALVEQVPRLPVMLLITARPEFEPPWPVYAHMGCITLGRLGREDAEALARRAVGGKALPKEALGGILAQSDGIPLFIEELIKSLIETGTLREEQDGYEMFGPYPAHAVPKTLTGLLQARLDRLGPAKAVAQTGAVIGREFSHELLSAVGPGSERELEGALQELLASGLIFRKGAGTGAVYSFKHALVQDAAYETLLRGPKRALHARIAEALENRFAEVVENRPEALAHHCTEAGLIEKAAALWGEAGLQSLQRSALLEATAQLNRALAQIATLPATAELRRQQIKFQVALANALMHTEGYASPATRAAFDRARAYMERAEALNEAPEDPLQLFAVIYGFWVGNYVAFNGDTLRDQAAQFLSLAEKQGSTVPRMVGHRLMATSLQCTGEIAESLKHYDRALALYEPAARRALTTHFGQDLSVVVLCNRAWTLWLLGRPAAARADSDRAVREAREAGHAGTLLYALAHATRTYFWTGDYAEAGPLVEEILVLAEEKGAAAWKAFAMMQKGWLLALTGAAAAAAPMIASGLAAWQATGSTLWMPCYLSNLALACAELGQADAAARRIGEAIAVVATSKATWCQAEVERIAGEIARRAPEPEPAKAQACFEHALAIARAQQAKAWELRAATSLARLWCDQGRRGAARALLAPVYAGFAEGLDTTDLTAAKALLDDLGPEAPRQRRRPAAPAV
jgi:DNA-binding response OmpR family regulator/class 3 adenylate cyclase/predicted ATPase